MTHWLKKTYHLKGELCNPTVLPTFQQLFSNALKRHSRARCLRASEEIVMTSTLIIAEIRAVVNRYFARKSPVSPRLMYNNGSQADARSSPWPLTLAAQFTMAGLPQDSSFIGPPQIVVNLFLQLDALLKVGCTQYSACYFILNVHSILLFTQF